MSLPSNQGQVLGVNLNCSESAGRGPSPSKEEHRKYGRSSLHCGISVPSVSALDHSRPIDPPAAVAACLLGRVAALLRRSGKEPRMAIEVAGGIGAAVGFVVRGLDDFRAGRFRSGMVRIDVI
jgi:hypothetical protein